MYAHNRLRHNIIRRRNRVKSVSESGVTRRGGHPKSISGATTTTDTNRPEANTGPNISPPTHHSLKIRAYLSVYPSDGSTPLICDRWPSHARLLQAFCGVVERKNVQTIRPTHCREWR